MKYSAFSITLKGLMVFSISPFVLIPIMKSIVIITENNDVANNRVTRKSFNSSPS